MAEEYLECPGCRGSGNVMRRKCARCCGIGLLTKNEETNMDTIRFDADEYEWAEVAGLGRCLVPKPPAPRVRPSDIWEGRRIQYNGSAIWTVWRLRRPDGGYFWTLLAGAEDPQGVVAPSRESLASQIGAWPAGWRWLS